MDMLHADEYKDIKVYVSITSIFQKQNYLLQTLSSIKDQTYKIDKCYIFLSDDEYLLDEGFKDRKITNENLLTFLHANMDVFEVRWTKNIGSYRKLIPLLKEKLEENCVIITIDDDTVYDNSMVRIYLQEYISNKCCIAGRFYTMEFDEICNIIYDQCKNNSEIKSVYNFHTGKGGVLYHPSFFKETIGLMFDESLFLTECKTADDVWFNFHRIANKIPCKTTRNFCTKDITQSFSLYMNINHHIDKNTNQSYNTNAMRSVARLLTNLGYDL